MNPTQQQIEAALRYANYQQTLDDYAVLTDPNDLYNPYAGCMAILAAAYQDAIAENEQLKAAIFKLNQP
jgi:hypothetical protein